jgi:hypothetical protein
LRNNILRHPERYNDAAAEYFKEAAFSSSSAWAFIDECLTPTVPEINDRFHDQGVDEQELYLAYKSYCAAIGRQPMGLDALKHELRQVLPLNWVDRRKGGKQPRRFVYLKLRPAFDFGEIGASCNLNALGSDGVDAFREWTAKYGALHPYGPEDLQRLAEPQQQEITVGVEAPALATPEPVQAMQGVQGDFNAENSVCRGEKIKPHTQQNFSNEGLHTLHTLHSDETGTESPPNSLPPTPTGATTGQPPPKVITPIPIPNGIDLDEIGELV